MLIFECDFAESIFFLHQDVLEMQYDISYVIISHNTLVHTVAGLLQFADFTATNQTTITDRSALLV